MKKQPELTALTRKKLIDTYFELIARGKKATVGAITERAGYNRCTFYRYFTDTVQLLDQVESEIYDAFYTALSQVTISKTPLEIIESLSCVYLQYGDYLSVLLGEYGDIRFTKRMKAIVSPMLKQFLATENASDITTELRVEFILSGVLAMVAKWYDMKRPITEEQLGMLIKSFIMTY